MRAPAPSPPAPALTTRTLPAPAGAMPALPMSALALPAALVAAALWGAPAFAQTLPAIGEENQYGDWIAACDNLASCVAIGTQADGGAAAHLILRRAAAPDAPVEAALALAAPETTPETAPEAGAAPAQIQAAAPGFAPPPYPATRDGDMLTAAVPDADLAGLIGALRARDALTLSAPGGSDPQQVSLRGASAALLRIDVLQGRVGTPTALVRRGDGAPTAPQASAPPATRIVAIAAVDPAPPRPAGVPAATEPNCADVPDLAFDLGAGATLRAVCDFAAAYNTAFRFWISDAAGQRPAAFALAGVDDPAILTNPGLTPDGALTATNLGRGLGDCGETQVWAWTGEAFALQRLDRMDACAGVPPDDWPTLYTTG